MNNFTTGPFMSPSGYEFRRISPGGTVWAVPTGSNYLTGVRPVVQGFSPNEAQQVFGTAIYPVGGRSAFVPAPASSIIPGYIQGGPVWGGNTQRMPIMSISEAQAQEEARLMSQAQAEQYALEQIRAQEQARFDAMQYDQMRTQTFRSLGVQPKLPGQFPKAKENFIMNAFDNFQGTLEDKINQAIAARNKLDYFQSIGVGVDTKGDLSGRLVKPKDVEYTIWQAYDEGGPVAAETVRKTILAQHKSTTGGRSKNVVGSVFRGANMKQNFQSNGSVAAPRPRSRSPPSNTRGAGSVAAVRPRSRSPKLDLRKATASEIAAYNRKQKNKTTKKKENEKDELFERMYGK
jgi:hypothetical protein